MIRESCLRGAVGFAVTGPVRPVTGSRCTRCRKTSGHHVAATAAPRDAVGIGGEVTWFQSSPEARRGVRATCGLRLFRKKVGLHLSSTHPNALGGATGPRLTAHIFCRDKGDYYEIGDGLPCFEGDDPALSADADDPTLSADAP